MTCDTCEYLKERIRFLEDQIGENAKEDAIKRVKERFKITHQTAWFIMALYNAKGRTLTRGWLADNRWTDQPGREYSSDKHVDVMIFKVRQALGKDTVKANWGRGHYMTPEGLQIVGEVLGV